MNIKGHYQGKKNKRKTMAKINHYAVSTYSTNNKAHWTE